MSTININENLDIGRYSSSHTNNLLYTIENPEGIYNNNNFIFIHGFGRYNYDTNNVGFAIKKDPFVMTPVDSLRSETMTLYSFDKDLNRVKGNYSEYALKLWVYPATDIRDIQTLTSEYEVKNMAGITNSLPISSYSSAGYSKSGWYIPIGSTENSSYNSLAEMLGSGKMGVSLYNDSGTSFPYSATTEYACHVCYDIDISTLGINYPSNEARGINEETLQLFNSNNFLGFHDAKTLDILKSSGTDSLRYYLSYDIYNNTTTQNSIPYTNSSMPIIFYNYSKVLSNNNKANYLGIYSGIGNMINGYMSTNGYCIPNPFSSFFIATKFGPCLIVPGVVKITEGA